MTTSYNFSAQINAINTYGNSLDWYMLAAVQTHEDKHLTRFLPALIEVKQQIEAEIESKIISNTGQTAAQAKNTILMNLLPFTNLTGQFNLLWFSKVNSAISLDHIPIGGPAYVAEKTVTTPMKVSICSYANANGWTPCSGCN